MNYVLSDIHGNLQRFEAILKQIDLHFNDTLYVLGDVIDRGEYGIEILQKIMKMPNVKMLLGNHEYMMMRALGFPYDGKEDIANESALSLLKLWFHNGGDVTYKAWKRLSKNEKAEIKEYLLSLPLNIDIDVNGNKYKLVHAAVEDVYEIFGESEGDTKTCYTVWDREAIFNMTEADFTIVFGHTPTINLQNILPMRIYQEDNLIGIDCGCANENSYGRLACIRLEDRLEFYSDKKINERKSA